MADTTRVLIVDDHPLVRRGTREILDADPRIDVIGEAADGEETLPDPGHTTGWLPTPDDALGS